MLLYPGILRSRPHIPGPRTGPLCRWARLSLTPCSPSVSLPHTELAPLPSLFAGLSHRDPSSSLGTPPFPLDSAVQPLLQLLGLPRVLSPAVKPNPAHSPAGHIFPPVSPRASHLPPVHCGAFCSLPALRIVRVQLSVHPLWSPPVPPTASGPSQDSNKTGESCFQPS